MRNARGMLISQLMSSHALNSLRGKNKAKDPECCVRFRVQPRNKKAGFEVKWFSLTISCCNWIFNYSSSYHRTTSDTNHWMIRTFFIAISTSCLLESISFQCTCGILVHWICCMFEATEQRWLSLSVLPKDATTWPVRGFNPDYASRPSWKRRLCPLDHVTDYARKPYNFLHSQIIIVYLLQSQIIFTRRLIIRLLCMQEYIIQIPSVVNF